MDTAVLVVAPTLAGAVAGGVAVTLGTFRAEVRKQRRQARLEMYVVLMPMWDALLRRKAVDAEAGASILDAMRRHAMVVGTREQRLVLELLEAWHEYARPFTPEEVARAPRLRIGNGPDLDSARAPQRSALCEATFDLDRHLSRPFYTFAPVRLSIRRRSDRALGVLGEHRQDPLLPRTDVDDALGSLDRGRVPPGDVPAPTLGAFASLRPLLGRRVIPRFVRYAAVSVVSTATTLLTLGLLVGVAGFSAAWSNVVATGVGTIPSFELNRRWVWSSTGRRSILRQAVPYLALSLSGLVISTIAVHLAADASAGYDRLVKTAAVEAASLGTFAVLWLVQFVLCDRILFRPGREVAMGDAVGYSAAATVQRAPLPAAATPDAH